jgi:tetratricopeptide (TPR) repeat protein
LQNYNKAIESDQNFALAYHYRGEVYVIKKEYKQALRDYDKTIELNPNNHDLFLKRENLYRKMR